MCILALFFRRYIGAFFSNEQGGHETLGIFSLFKRFFFALRFKGEGAIFYLRFSPFPESLLAIFFSLSSPSESHFGKIGRQREEDYFFPLKRDRRTNDDLSLLH